MVIFQRHCLKEPDHSEIIWVERSAAYMPLSRMARRHRERLLWEDRHSVDTMLARAGFTTEISRSSDPACTVPERTLHTSHI